MTNVVVLSALFGSYEWPKPVPPDLGVPAVMMVGDTDLEREAEEQGWTTLVDIHPLAPWLNDNRNPDWDPAATVPMMEHKFWKCRPELAWDADIVIWMDASMTITAPNFVDLCLEALGDDDWAVMTHPWRNCVYDEATFSGHLSRYDKASLDAQADFYRSIGHPPNWGLFATGFSVRRMTDRVKEIGEQWWWECTTRTHQDQVSLPVLFRLAEDLKWNTRLPWIFNAQWLHLGEHGR